MGLDTDRAARRPGRARRRVRARQRTPWRRPDTHATEAGDAADAREPGDASASPPPRRTSPRVSRLRWSRLESLPPGHRPGRQPTPWVGCLSARPPPGSCEYCLFGPPPFSVAGTLAAPARYGRERGRSTNGRRCPGRRNDGCRSRRHPPGSGRGGTPSQETIRRRAGPPGFRTSATARVCGRAGAPAGSAASSSRSCCTSTGRCGTPNGRRRVRRRRSWRPVGRLPG